MVKIKEIKAYSILDSRGKPTLEVGLTTASGFSLASVPTGTSTGSFEAKSLPVKEALEKIEKVITPKLIGLDVSSPEKIDQFLLELDGTKDKSFLGANAILAISLAVHRAGGQARKIPLWQWLSEIAGTKPRLPKTSLLLVEGGLHGSGGPEVQEFMIASSLFLAKEIYQKLKKYKYQTGLEGAFIVPFKETEKVLDLILSVAGEEIEFILDVAATHDSPRNVAYYLDLIKKYPILALEDPFAEADWSNWQKLFFEIQKLGAKTLLIADDLTVTNVERIKEAYQKKACNGVIIKPNQIGTVSETIAAVKLAQSYSWSVIVSHRSGETLDDFIADLAVGLGADFIKSGAPFPPERMAKYNRLLEIEKEL